MCTPEPILLPYQRAWIQDRSRIKVHEKSRRTGVTWASALEAVLEASNANGGMDVHYLTYAEKDSKKFILDCVMWVGVLEALQGEKLTVDEHGVQVLEIRFKTGFTIYGKPGKGRNLRGCKGRAIIDESAHVDDLEDIETAATAFIMWGGFVEYISTHSGEDNYFNKLVARARDEEPEWGFHSTPLSKAIEQGLPRRIAVATNQVYSEEWAHHWEHEVVRKFYGEAGGEELDCIPSRQGSSYFDPAAVALCRKPELKVLRWKKPREWENESPSVRAAACSEWIKSELLPVLRALNPMRGHAMGIDYARYGDMASWMLAEIHGQVRRAVLTVELSNMPQQQQQQILSAIMTTTKRMAKVHMDRTGNGQALAEWARTTFGPVCEGIAITSKWHDESWSVLRQAVAERHVDLPDDDEICSDFRLVENIDGKPRIVKRRTKAKGGGFRHGDAAVACALMWNASKGHGSRAGSSVGPSAPSSRSGF